MLKRCMSTISMRTVPSKEHLHRQIPDSAFPKGYLLTGIHAGVKKKADALDLGLIISTSEHPAAAAACFTKNAFKAAPVIVSEETLVKNGGYARAVVVNSGCANAVTGRKGLEDAWAMVHETAGLLPHRGDKPEVLVMSTGVIGQTLPISNVTAGISSQAEGKSTRSLASNFPAWERLAKAFMTTDTFPKLRSRTFTINGVEYSMAGMDKGAGMIHPNMGPPRNGALHATLLGCILTDAAVSPKSLQSALNHAVGRSFNSISVDGDMSTNDTIVVLANGAGAKDARAVIDEETDKDAYESFKHELTELAIQLAELVVRDGEGATKFVTITVQNANTFEDAHSVASKISTSALVKTALYGEDANWGRVLAAMGSIPLSKPLDLSNISVTFSANNQSLPVLIKGEPVKVDEEFASSLLQNEDLEILVDSGMGGANEAKYYTCDLSYEYVRINGDYRS